MENGRYLKMKKISNLKKRLYKLRSLSTHMLITEVLVQRLVTVEMLFCGQKYFALALSAY